MKDLAGNTGRKFNMKFRIVVEAVEEIELTKAG